MHDSNLDLLEKLAHRVRTLNRDTLDTVGLGPGQRRILQAVLDRPGIISAGLARHLKLDKSTVSRALKHLDEAGYIRKSPIPDNDKSFALTPTNMALVLGSNIENRAEHDESVVFAGFSEADRQQFRLFLQGALANLDGHGRPDRIRRLTDAAYQT